MKLTVHQLRCLGAIAALTDAQSGKVRFHSRWEIGCIIYAKYQGVQIKPLIRMWAAGLVGPQVEAAVQLYQEGICRCGCDRWAITDRGRDELTAANVKVPKLNMRMRPVPTMEEMFGEPQDPADWWKE